MKKRIELKIQSVWNRKRTMAWARIFLPLLTALAAFWLAGCQSRDMHLENTESTGAKESLVLWSYYETDAQIQGLNDLVSAFNQTQDQYELRWEYVTMSDFDRRISRAYTEKALPDLVLIDNPDMLRFIQLGIFEDITEYAADLELDTDFYPASASTVCRNGHYFGVPFNSNNVCLIYNKEIFETLDLEIPEDWESFAAVAGKAAENGYDGFLMSCINSEQGAFQLLSWIMSASERMDRKGVSDAFSFLMNLVRTGVLSAECLNYSQTDIARKFAQGKIAMMENGPWVFSMLDEADISYGLAPLPKGARFAVILGGENLGVLKGKNVDGSMAFIRYCMKEGGIDRFCRTAQILPSRIESAEKYLEENPQMAVIAEQMEVALPRTEIEGWNSYSGKITSAFAQMLEGKLTPEQAATQIFL